MAGLGVRRGRGEERGGGREGEKGDGERVERETKRVRHNRQYLGAESERERKNRERGERSLINNKHDKIINTQCRDGGKRETERRRRDDTKYRFFSKKESFIRYKIDIFSLQIIKLDSGDLK